MKKGLFRKGLILGIILLFVGAGIVPSTVGIREKKTINMPIISGGYIQGLIDNASDGDTIYIPSGTYYENIIINKSISLIGEDKNTTIIDGDNDGNVVHVSADWVNISGFTIRYGNDNGLYISHSDKNTITGNNISSNNNNGIRFYWSYGNTITGNTITNNSRYGIYSAINCIIKDNTITNNEWDGILGISRSIITGNNISNNRYSGIEPLGDNNTITNNTISNNQDGIIFHGSSNNTIIGNIISSNNRYGIYLGRGRIYPPGTPVPCVKNSIESNTISNNGETGIILELSHNNAISKNNFINNNVNAFFEFSFFNRWKQNYWDEPRILPKLIIGTLIEPIPWINIDWHPAEEPYDIGV